MKRPSADRRDRQRADLTRLATGIIEEDGLAGLQARRLAERAGCAVGTVYNLFADLDGVIFAANEESLREIDAACRDALAAVGGESGATGRLLALAHAYARYAIAHPKRFDALFTHRAPAERALPESFAELTRSLFGLLGSVFSDAVAGMPDNERGLAARALWASAHGVVMLGLQDRGGLLAREEARRRTERAADRQSRRKRVDRADPRSYSAAS
ncbi:MAG: hypothetical protein BGP06_11430 [Rhizobiales bacterium 65-9]|nr:MAG: hypothetical protein BGP06_11430 [Rhizobiales bacterium 65-9]